MPPLWEQESGKETVRAPGHETGGCWETATEKRRGPLAWEFYEKPGETSDVAR